MTTRPTWPPQAATPAGPPPDKPLINPKLVLAGLAGVVLARAVQGSGAPRRRSGSAVSAQPSSAPKAKRTPKKRTATKRTATKRTATKRTATKRTAKKRTVAKRATKKRAPPKRRSTKRSAKTLTARQKFFRRTIAELTSSGYTGNKMIEANRRWQARTSK